jgi:hypothetical protein
MIAPPAGVTDTDLLRRWLDDVDEGETFIIIYGRFRQEVREALQAAGLQPMDAEDRVGAVFARAEATRHDLPPETPLRARLLAAVRAVAADPGAEQSSSRQGEEPGGR